MPQKKLATKEKSKSTLFLIEQIIVIAVFAICAAVCVRIIVSAYMMTADAVDTRNALTIAESAAESFKAFEGDAALVFAVLSERSANTQASGNYSQNSIVVVCDRFSLEIAIREGSARGLLFADIAITGLRGGEELVTLTVATRTGGAD